MTLDEAIEHAREVSSQECAECKKEHEQLANWLEELKQLRNVIDSNYDIDKLKKLIEADKDRRCFISDVKLGGEVFYIPKFDGNPYLGIQKGHVQAISFTRAGKRIKIREYHNYNKDFMLGKNVFLSYEEAKNIMEMI